MSSEIESSSVVEAGRLPVLHAFEYGDTWLAYFVTTGDLIRVSRAAYDALAAMEAGAVTDEVACRLHAAYDEETARAVLEDLSRLTEHGYFTPEIELTTTEIAKNCDALLKHKPRNLMFFVTEACNLACAYCYEKNQGVHDTPRVTKPADARRILDRYFEDASGREEICITFFGGEPLLNFPLIVDAVVYAKEKAQETGARLSFTMTTNATLVTPAIAAFLAENQFHVMVSIDGKKEDHDRYRIDKNGAGTYDSVVNGLQLLIDAMRKARARLPKIRATMTAENQDRLELERHLRSLGTHLVEIGETHGTVAGGTKEYDIGLSSAANSISIRRREAIQALRRDPQSVPELPPSLIKALKRVHEEVTRTETHTTVGPQLCGVCRNMRAVTPTGDLYPCHRYVGMEAFRFGNIHDGGMDALKMRVYYESLHGRFAEKCTQCWARHLCGGQCPWYLSRIDGTIAAPDEATCVKIREGFEDAIGFYAVLMNEFPSTLGKLLGQDVNAVKGEACNRAPDQSCRS